MTPANPDALADALAQVTAEKDRLARINRDLCASHNALNIDGAKWEARAKTAEARAAQLQAEVEAKDRVLKLLLVFVDCAGGEGIVLGGGSYGIPDTDATDICVDVAKALGIEFAGPEYMALIEQGQRLYTALARAATAGEGRADETELERLRKENKELQTQLDALVQEVLRNG